MRGLGTLINVGLVVAGSGIGLAVGNRIPERARTTMLQVIGLVTLALGLSDAIGTHNMVFPLVGMAVGAMIGELLAIEDRLERLGARLQRRVSPPVVRRATSVVLVVIAVLLAVRA